MSSKNDVVIIANEKIPRDFWKLGLIQKCLVSSDEKCRFAKVKTTLGRILIRPILQLFPLELN